MLNMPFLRAVRNKICPPWRTFVNLNISHPQHTMLDSWMTVMWLFNPCVFSLELTDCHQGSVSFMAFSKKMFSVLSLPSKEWGMFFFLNVMWHFFPPGRQDDILWKAVVYKSESKQVCNINKKKLAGNIALIITKKTSQRKHFLFLFYERSERSKQRGQPVQQEIWHFFKLDFKVHEALGIITTLSFVATLFGPPRQKHFFDKSLRKCYDITGRKSSITEEKLSPDLLTFLC